MDDRNLKNNYKCQVRFRRRMQFKEELLVNDN
jgi:hypothetical protein